MRPQRRYHCKNRRCFNPRTPRGVRRVSQRCRSPDSCFNPRTPRGVRHVAVHRQRTDWRFQSTRPVRGATPRHADLEHIVSFQSTRPVRGATRFNGPNQAFFLVSIHAPRAGRDDVLLCCGFLRIVSIHAPRAGRDDLFYRAGVPIHVSIHAPRAGRDPARDDKAVQAEVFQSTRPVRGATYFLISSRQK